MLPCCQAHAWVCSVWWGEAGAHPGINRDERASQNTGEGGRHDDGAQGGGGGHEH